MPICTNDEFYNKCFDFIKKNNISETTFGLKSNNDGRFFYDLKRGREFGEKIKKRVLGFMDNFSTIKETRE